MQLSALLIVLVSASWGNDDCPSSCNSRGECVDGMCLCKLGFFGTGCENKACPFGCNGRGKCEASGVCTCSSDWAGEACDEATGTKADASLSLASVVLAAPATCPNDCSGRGTCMHNGQCACDVRFVGEGCQHPRCPNDCGSTQAHGTCRAGVCTCAPGWTGPGCADLPKKEIITTVGQTQGIDLGKMIQTMKDAETAECVEGCNQQGKCNIDGSCSCYTGYTGPGCENYCPNGCAGRGECIEGGCLCMAGWGGVDCSQKICCNGHGDCDLPDTCVCHKGWMGALCGVPMSCPDPTCNSHGDCELGSCECKGGWTDDLCSTEPSECDPACPAGVECNRMTGQCISKDGSPAGGAAAGGGGGGGDDDGGGGGSSPLQDVGGAPAAAAEKKAAEKKKKDAKPVAPPDCGVHGKYNDTLTECECDDTWFTFEEPKPCARQHCPEYIEGEGECNGNGVCLDGACHCMAGFGLSNATRIEAGLENVCLDKVCLLDCGRRGECTDGNCVCQPGWTGDACNEPKCLNDCSDHGLCTFTQPDSPGECRCEVSWFGASCDKQLDMQQCPNSCQGNGLCLDGQCVCADGWTGPDCTTRLCGDAMFLGPKCDLPSCPGDCDGKGLCMEGKCQCWLEYSGADCSIPMQCYEACAPSCKDTSSTAKADQCEYCKGRCVELSSHVALGQHNPFADLAK